MHHRARRLSCTVVIARHLPGADEDEPEPGEGAEGDDRQRSHHDRAVQVGMTSRAKVSTGGDMPEGYSQLAGRCRG
jgi:hypothetical protein